MPKVRNDEISIHAAREGGDHSSHLVCLLRIRISIHAAREGGDSECPQFVFNQMISIHAAREGGDHTQGARPPLSVLFQSTPPVKAATNFDIR